MPGPVHAALPSQLREMADACGVSQVMVFIAWKGNSRFYVPKTPLPESHEMVKMLGRQTADWLVERFGGETLIVPRAVALLRSMRDKEIQAMKGKSSAAVLARQHGLHERQIFRIWSEGPEEPEEIDPQGSLLG